MSILNKVGRPKKVKSVMVNLTEDELWTLMTLVNDRHHSLINDGWEDGWAYGDCYEEMGAMYTMGAKLEELQRKVRDA